MNQSKQDRLIRAVAADSAVRAFAIDGTALVECARQTHGLSRTATAALGRQLMMTVMMASELKGREERLSTMIAGNGPGGNMVCTGRASGEVKGYIVHGGVELGPNASGKLDVSGLVGGRGRLTVVKDLGMRQPYVGSAALTSGEIAEDFAAYYMQSLQQPSVVYLGVHVDAGEGKVRAAGGVMLQPLPACPEDTMDALAALAPGIARFTGLLEGEASPENALKRVLDSLDVCVTDSLTPQYRCDCCKERIEKALISLGEQELRAMIQEDGQAEVCCHFCNRKYHFTGEELQALLEEAKQ